MTSIVSSLGPLKAIKGGRMDVQTPKRASVQTAERANAQAAERPPLQGTAKRSHPDFSKRTVYVRDKTHREAMRRYEDNGGREFSDLVEILLQQYIGRPNA